LSDVELLARAWRVAAERHVDHRRKGSRAEPYVNHLAEVADLVAAATGGSDARLVAAAVLHDTIEDTGMSLAELDRLFGSDVAGLVAEVSDDKNLTREERKRLQVESALPSDSPCSAGRGRLTQMRPPEMGSRLPIGAWRLGGAIWTGRAVAAGLRGVNP
jgi:hypothetical protein